MIWVFVFGGIALLGLVMVIAYGIWLAHKAADVYAELTVLAQRGGKLADALAEIDVAQIEVGPVEGPRPGLERTSAQASAE